MDLEEALSIALQDEYKARATYRKVLEKFGEVFPFVNIIQSEERHIRALEDLFEEYEFSIPTDDWQGKIDDLSSVREALAAGAAAERENGALYDRLIEATTEYADVRETFRRLRRASQDNHLPAFERCLARNSEPLECGDIGVGGHRHRHGQRG